MLFQDRDLDNISRSRSLEIVLFIFIFPLKIHFFVKMKIRRITSLPMVLILINVTKFIILNNIQEILAIILANIDDIL